MADWPEIRSDADYEAASAKWMDNESLLSGLSPADLGPDGSEQLQRIHDQSVAIERRMAEWDARKETP